MAYRVHLTDKALADADATVLWLQQQGASAAAQRWFSSLWTAIDTLESHPGRCPRTPEAEDIGREIRELVFGKRRGTYRILIEVRDRTVYVLRIWHSARDAFTAGDL